MSNATRPHRPRLLYFGMRCAFSTAPLAALIEAGCDLRAVVLPGPPGSPALRYRPTGGNLIRLPVAGLASDIDDLADRAGIPIIETGDLRAPETVAGLRELAPDAIAVACFPWLIPAALRRIPALGCLNLHPSLLPRWRGPEPLFWTFMAGDDVTGVTVHLMDGGFDTGPIVMQDRVPVAEGVDGLAFERELATLGGQLLVRAIAGLANGTVSPRAQDDALAIPAPMPTDDDLVIRNDQPARRIFNLVRGIEPLWGPLTLRIVETGEAYSVIGALAFEADAVSGPSVLWNGQTLRVRCAPGLVWLDATPALQPR